MYMILWHASADLRYQMLGEVDPILSIGSYLLIFFLAVPIAGKSSQIIVYNDVSRNKNQLRIWTYCLVRTSLFLAGFFSLYSHYNPFICNGSNSLNFYSISDLQIVLQILWYFVLHQLDIVKPSSKISWEAGKKIKASQFKLIALSGAQCS